MPMHTLEPVLSESPQLGKIHSAQYVAWLPRVEELVSHLQKQLITARSFYPRWNVLGYRMGVVHSKNIASWLEKLIKKLLTVGELHQRVTCLVEEKVQNYLHELDRRAKRLNELLRSTIEKWAKA